MDSPEIDHDAWDAFLEAEEVQTDNPSRSLMPAEFGDDASDFLVNPDLPVVTKPMVAAVATDLERCFFTDALTVDSWQREVRAIGRMAAVSGKFDSSLECMKALAASMGVDTRQRETSSQHVHFHSQQDLIEQSSDDLKTKLAEIQRKRENLARSVTEVG